MTYRLLTAVFVTLLVTTSYADKRTFVGNNRSALELAIQNLSPKQVDSLTQLSLSAPSMGEVRALRFNSQQRSSRVFDYALDGFISDIQAWIALHRGTTSRTIVSLRLAEVKIFSFVSATGGFADAPMVRVELTLSGATGECVVYGITVSGRSYMTGVFESFSKSEKTRLYFAEALYRALILTMLQAAGLATEDEVKESLRFRAHRAKQPEG